MSNYDKAHTCEFCKKSFAKEKTLLAHLCEKKRRHLQKDSKHVIIGFQAFNQFYKLSTSIKKEKTYTDFCNSSSYNAFVRFGSYVHNVQPIYPSKYIDYVVTSGVKLDHWCKDELYEQYILELIFKEDPLTAVERSIITMTNWAEDNKTDWKNYFSHATASRLTWDLRDGKMSPWLVLNCNSGKKALASLSDEQLSIINNVLDPAHWKRQIKYNQSDVELIKKLAEENKL